MPMFFLDIEAMPTSTATCAPEAVGASILMFIMADSRPEAEAMARAEIIDHGWITVDIPLFLQPTDEQLAALDENIHAAYEQALQHGIGCLFMIYPKEEEMQDDPVEVYALNLPAFISNRSHKK